MGFRRAHAGNYRAGRSRPVRYIVIHYTANNGDTAAGNATYFALEALKLSAHYFVDEREVWQSVKEGDTAYHCGAKTYKHPQCRNDNSIGIELCSRMDGAGRYYFMGATVERAAALARELMAKYNIPIERVLRHYDVTGKNCPAPMVQQPARWVDFKKRLEGEEMTQEQFNAMYEKAVQAHADKVNAQPVSSWAAEAWAKAKAEGVFDGTMPRAALTREQAAVILDRVR